MQDFNLSKTDPRSLSPAALAFIGDGVFELLARGRILEKGSMPAHKLHGLSVQRVCASAQALAYLVIEPALNQEELNILKRGRNANTPRVPKSCSPEEYRKATAVEALFGYLYLKGELKRAAELFSIIEENREA